MQRTVRHVILFLLAALLLNACADATAPPAPGASSAQATPEDIVTGDATPGSADPEGGAPITIGFAAQEFERQAYEPLIEEFNAQNPDVRVRFIPYSEILGDEGMFDASSMTRQLVSGADTVSAPFVQAEDIAAGLLRDLAPLIEGDPTFDRGDYYPGALEQLGQNGVYALPQTLGVELLNYNKDLWAARGLPEPQPDWTWADLIAAAEQLTRKRGDQVDVYGFVDFNAPARALASELIASGALDRLASADSAQLDDPDVAAALERVASLVESGAIYPPAQASGPPNFDDLQKLIDGGQAAMWLAEMGEMGRRITIGGGPDGGGPEAEEPPARPFAVGSAPMPPLPVESFRGGGISYVMSAGAQHPEAAWRWLSFLSRQNVASPFKGSIGQVPARKSIAEQSGYWDRLDAETRAAVEGALVRLATPASDVALDPLVIEALAQAFGAVLDGEPVQRALTDAQAQLSQQVAQAQLTPTAAPEGPVIVATPAPDVAPPGAKPLTFSSFGLGAGDARQLARQFNQEHPELFVQIEQPAFGGKPLNFADIAATSDCFAWFGPPDSDEITATLDLVPLLDADPAFRVDDYPALLLAPFRQGAGLYGLPDQVSLRTLTYSPAAFEIAGAELPSAGWTIDQFLDAAQKLTSGDEKDERYGFASIASSAQDLLFFLRMYGASPTSGSGDTVAPNFTDPQVVQAVRAYLDLLEKNSPHDQLTGYTRQGIDGEALPLIADGRVAMWFDYGAGGRGVFFVRAAAASSSDAEPEQAIAPPPFGASGAAPDDANASGLYISANSQNVEGCWEWIKFLSGAASRFTDTFPARTSVATSPAFLGQARPGASEVYAAYADLLGRSDAPAAAMPIDYYWLFRAADRALAGEDLERELAEAQVLTEQHLACVRGGGAPRECATQVDPEYDGIGSMN